MFNLNQAIAGWRRQMLDAGVKASEVLNELESHLREDVERQMHSGESMEKAFEVAVRRVGEANALKAEFAKTGRRGVREKLMIAVCVFWSVSSLY